MDDDYYTFTLSRSQIIDNIHIASPEALIALKAKAYVEMLERREAGEMIDSRDIEKHKKDVFRLIAMLPEDLQISVPERIKRDVVSFCKHIGELPNADFFKHAGLRGLNADTLLSQLQVVFSNHHDAD